MSAREYQGYFLAVFGTSSVLGPVVGGFFAGQATILGIAGWRWVFLVNVPIGIVALVVVAAVLNLPHTRRDHRIDWRGALALIVGLVPLLIVAEQGRGWGWGSPRPLGLLRCSASSACVVVHPRPSRRMGDEALIPLRLFRNRTFSLTSVVGVHRRHGHVRRASSSLPLYLQIVQGPTPDRGRAC